jgi:hypothetical protein
LVLPWIHRLNGKLNGRGSQFSCFFHTGPFVRHRCEFSEGMGRIGGHDKELVEVLSLALL